MKKLLAYLLILSVFLGLCPPAVAEQQTLQKPLPAVGDTIHGFEVKELGTLDLVNAPTVLFEHIQTGALLYYIQADDINRTFEITFRTPALDDTGAPHVFEHATLGGSEKYPHQNFFYSLISQAYTTFINAFTFETGTSYPLSSLSEDQLYALADVYMDGVFNPSIMTDERLFSREAWRYELNDPEGELSLNGTVYSEMKGAYTLPRAASNNLKRGLYEGSLLPNEPGGAPEAIPDLTYQQIVDFHDAYYHPSNAMIILYGDLDYARFMKLFDEEYLSKYERQEIALPDYSVEKPDAPVTKTYTFPVEAGSPGEDASYVYYGFALDDKLSGRDKIGLSVLAAALNHEGSPLMRLAREKLPGKNFSAGVSLFTPKPYFYFLASDVNESDGEVVRAIVEEGLETILRDGFEREIIDALLAAEKFSILTIPETQNIGNSIATTLSMIWTVDGSLDYFNSYLEALDFIEAEAGEGFFEKYIETYLIDNPWSALVATVPAPGLVEENAAALKEKLAAYKSSLSEEEVLGLIERTAELTAFGLEETPKALLERVQAVTVESLPEEVEHYEVLDREADGVRYLTAEANVGGISMTNLALDTSGVALEDLHYLNLFAGLIGELNTQAHTKEELQTLMIRYLNSFYASATLLDPNGDSFDPILSVQWMNLSGEYREAVDLVDELLFSTKYDDADDIAAYVSRARSSLKNSIVNTPYMIQIKRAFAIYSEQYAYDSYLSGLDYYRFLVKTEKLLGESPEVVAQKLSQIQDQLRNRNGALATYAGNAEGIAEFEEMIPAFFGSMRDEPVKPSDYSSIPRPSAREALVIDSAVQYNMVYAPLEKVGLEDSGKLAPLNAYLYGNYQMPKIRNDLGAYGILNGMDESGVFCCSYRDPGIAPTFEAFEAMGAFLRDSQATQEEIDRFIISVYSGYAMPVGALSGALQAISRYLSGKTDEDLLRKMREAKAFTLEDIHLAADAFDRLTELGARSTAGGAAAIEAEAERYDNILYLNALDQ